MLATVAGERLVLSSTFAYHGNQRESEPAKLLRHTTWNHFKESGQACLNSCQLSVLSSFTPKAEEMMAFPLTVGSEEILLLMLQLLIYAKHVSVQQHDSIKSAAALVSLIRCVRAGY